MQNRNIPNKSRFFFNFSTEKRIIAIEKIKKNHDLFRMLRNFTHPLYVFL